jgi:hypothetical protein
MRHRCTDWQELEQELELARLQESELVLLLAQRRTLELVLVLAAAQLLEQVLAPAMVQPLGRVLVPAWDWAAVEWIPLSLDYTGIVVSYLYTIFRYKTDMLRVSYRYVLGFAVHSR